MFEALAASGLANYVQSSVWCYPFLLSVHGLGMAAVVGFSLVTSLRVLGFPKKVALGDYKATQPYLLLAFIANASTGVVLFIADAASLAANVSFQIKVVSLLVGLVVLWRLYGGVLKRAAADPGYQATGGDKAIAVATIAIWWLSVIVSGRLVAYVQAAV